MMIQFHKFQVLKVLGMFACELDKNGSFKKMHWCKYFMIAFSWFATIFSLTIASYIYVMYKADINFKTLVKKTFSRYHYSTTTKLAIYSSIVLANLKCVILLVNNFKLSRNWPNYWSNLNKLEVTPSKTSEKVIERSAKWLKR